MKDFSLRRGVRPKPKIDTVMPKFKYVGQESDHQLAGVGVLQPNQIFDCTSEQGEALDRNDPEGEVYVRQKTPAKDAKGKQAEGENPGGDPPAT